MGVGGGEGGGWIISQEIPSMLKWRLRMSDVPLLSGISKLCLSPLSYLPSHFST